MRKYNHLLSISIMIILIYSILHYSNQTEESFTYFPADQNAYFKIAETSLTLLDKSNEGYPILWRTGSNLDRKAYLRQDISFLYGNGILIDSMGKEWKQQTDKINMEKKIVQNESANFKTISFHHGEIHSNDSITSAQKITHDELYVLDSKFSTLHSFHQPSNKEEQEWKSIIDNLIQQRLQTSLENAQKTIGLNPVLYTIFPLTDIYQYEEKPLPGFNAQETKEIIGRLWEGLYKNYFLGVQKKDGTTTDPRGSSIPLILISKDKTHLLVISQLSNGEVVSLRQQIPSP
ncbi:MAG TPA: hypothetical protein VM660_02300 [Bacillus sp. (in: firmicutes)]|nr:hypothetical protein [Bacillus sp. (in: firmicutes)]